MTLRSIAVIFHGLWLLCAWTELSSHHPVSWNIILRKMRVKKETSLRRNYSFNSRNSTLEMLWVSWKTENCQMPLLIHIKNKLHSTDDETVYIVVNHATWRVGFQEMLYHTLGNKILFLCLTFFIWQGYLSFKNTRKKFLVEWIKG